MLQQPPEKTKQQSESVEPIAAPDGLFPLPLTAFEQFMLTDESPGFPMAFYLQLRFRGVFDDEVAKNAFAEALHRHPLLCCKVERRWNGTFWVWAGDDPPVADWDRERWSVQEPWKQAIDLTQQTGLRIWAEQHDDHAVITFQFHHACCDGIGAAQFLEDIAVGYARQYSMKSGSTDKLPEYRELDFELLKHRNSPVGRRVANVPGSIARRIHVVLKYTLRYLRQQKLPLLSAPDQVPGDQQNDLGLVTLKLNRKQTRGLREAAKQFNASLNDLLVTELMIASEGWNRTISKQRPQGGIWKQPTLCVLVPTSLRGPSDTELSACNVVSYVFMARPVDLVDQPVELLRSIRDEMQLVHKFQAGWLFVQAINAMRKMPGMLRLIMLQTRNSCMCTTVLSHMGNLMNAIGSRLPRQDGCIKMGNLLVEEVCGIPPIRKGTSAAFSTMIINGCLSISLRCCSERFSQTARNSLLQRFSDQLSATSGIAMDHVTNNTQEKTVPTDDTHP